MTARRHHHVSQCYLKGFAADRDNPKLFVIDGKAQTQFTTSPLNVAAERDFHAIDVEGLPSDAFETGLSVFETELSLALERIIAARSIGNERDRAYLLNLVALQAVKSPRHRANFADFEDEIMKRIMQLATATPERWASQMRQMKEAGVIEADAADDYEKIKDLIDRDQFRFSFSTGHHLGLELKGYEAVLPFMFRRGWMLFRAPPNCGGFITSDHPVCLMWADPKMREQFFAPGHGVARTQVIFPISKELAMAGAFEIHNDEREISELMLAQLNATIILHSERQFYACDDTFIYKMEHNSRIMRGSEFLADQRFSRPSDD